MPVDLATRQGCGSVSAARRLSFLTLQRGNAVLDALRPLLRTSISATD
ncbi:DUF1534 domain-containing protein [Pseudomonas syringae]|nr:DUF1534 domain-containing protein [Pseudomonas syringae]